MNFRRPGDVWYSSRGEFHNEPAGGLTLIRRGRALCPGHAVAVSVDALAAEMGIESEKSVEIISDADATMCISNRSSSGKVRHLKVAQL